MGRERSAGALNHFLIWPERQAGSARRSGHERALRCDRLRQLAAIGRLRAVRDGHRSFSTREWLQEYVRTEIRVEGPFRAGRSP